MFDAASMTMPTMKGASTKSHGRSSPPVTFVVKRVTEMTIIAVVMGLRLVVRGFAMGCSCYCCSLV